MYAMRAIRLSRQFARVLDLKTPSPLTTNGQRHAGARMPGEDFVDVRNLHISRMLGKEGKTDPPPTATRAAQDKTAAAPTADPKGSSDKDTGFTACACGPKGERPRERAEVARAEEKKQKVAEFMNKIRNVGAGWTATGTLVANVTKSTAIGVNGNQLLALALRDSIQCQPKLDFHSSTYFQNGSLVLNSFNRQGLKPSTPPKTSAGDNDLETTNGFSPRVIDYEHDPSYQAKNPSTPKHSCETVLMKGSGEGSICKSEEASGAAKGGICSSDKGGSCKAMAGGGGGKEGSGKGGNCSGGAKGGKGDQGKGSGKRPTGAGAKPATTNGQDKPSKKQMERESRVLFKMSTAPPQCDNASQQIAGQKESCKSIGKKGGKPEGTQCRGGVTAAAPASKIDGSETLESSLAAEERPQPETRLYSEQCKSYANDRVGSKDKDKETCPGAKDHDKEICKQGEGKKIESRSASGTKATGASICSNLTAKGSSSKSDSNCPKSKPKKDGSFVAGKMNSDLKACKSSSNQTNGCGKKDPCKKSISICPEPKNGKGSCKESSSIRSEPKNGKGSCKESSSICPEPKNGKGSCKESSSICPEPKHGKGSCKESSSSCPEPKKVSDLDCGKGSGKGSGKGNDKGGRKKPPGCKCPF